MLKVRALGFTHRRHLGPLQMTTDTALITAYRVLEEKKILSEVFFVLYVVGSKIELEILRFKTFVLGIRVTFSRIWKLEGGCSG